MVHEQRRRMKTLTLLEHDAVGRVGRLLACLLACSSPRFSVLYPREREMVRVAGWGGGEVLRRSEMQKRIDTSLAGPTDLSVSSVLEASPPRSSSQSHNNQSPFSRPVACSPPSPFAHILSLSLSSILDLVDLSLTQSLFSSHSTVSRSSSSVSLSVRVYVPILHSAKVRHEEGNGNESVKDSESGI